MRCEEIIRTVMKADGISQAKLAEKMNYKTQSAVGNALARVTSMKVSMFIKFMNTMGYEVIVRRGKEELVVTEE